MGIDESIDLGNAYGDVVIVPGVNSDKEEHAEVDAAVMHPEDEMQGEQVALIGEDGIPQPENVTVHQEPLDLDKLGTGSFSMTVDLEKQLQRARAFLEGQEEVQERRPAPNNDYGDEFNIV